MPLSIPILTTAGVSRSWLSWHSAKSCANLKHKTLKARGRIISPQNPDCVLHSLHFTTLLGGSIPACTGMWRNTCFPENPHKDARWPGPVKMSETLSHPFSTLPSIHLQQSWAFPTSSHLIRMSIVLLVRMRRLSLSELIGQRRRSERPRESK